MIARAVRRHWLVILMLAALAAGVALDEASNRLVRRAAVLLIVYSAAIAIIWVRVRLALRPPTLRTLRTAFQSWRSFVVDHLRLVIREK
jgi:hypothetical protein